MSHSIYKQRIKEMIQRDTDSLKSQLQILANRVKAQQNALEEGQLVQTAPMRIHLTDAIMLADRIQAYHFILETADHYTLIKPNRKETL